MRKQRRHTLVLQFGENEVKFAVPYSDAKKDLVFERISADARNGKPGLVGECMDHQCIKRQPNIFPHPAYFAEVTADRVWIVDKVDRRGQPAHLVRYIRPTKDRHDIRAFDPPGAKKAILAGRTDVVVERPIKLLAPRPGHKSNPWGNRVHPDNHDGSRRKPTVSAEPRPRGALARRIRAGLLSL